MTASPPSSTPAKDSTWALFKVWGPAVLGLVGLVALYWLAFRWAERGEVLARFDSVTTLDMAQVARNTLRGEFLRTRLVTPTGWTMIGHLEDHPDFFRYPLPTIVYAILFVVFPATPATVKLFNGVLFVANGALMAMVAWNAIAKLELGERIHPVMQAGLCWSAAIITSVFTQDYFEGVLSDDYEVMTGTLLLIVILMIQRNARGLLLGAALGALYLSRSNMGLILPIVLLLRAWQLRDRPWSELGLGLAAIVAGFVIVDAPFMARSYYYTGKLNFSLPSLVELPRDVAIRNSRPYEAFRVPPTFAELWADHRDKLYEKVWDGSLKALKFITRQSYWWGLVPLAGAFVLLRSERPLLTALLAALLGHVVVVSLFLQKPRVYIPFFITIFAFSSIAMVTATYLGWYATWPGRHGTDDEPKTPPARAGYIPLALAMLVALIVVRRSDTLPIEEAVRRMRAPDEKALADIKAIDPTCVYANNQFWVVWETDVIVMPIPNHVRELKDGPPECTHYLRDLRFRKRLAYAGLRRHSRRVAKGKNYEIYELDPPDEIAKPHRRNRPKRNAKSTPKPHSKT